MENIQIPKISDYSMRYSQKNNEVRGLKSFGVQPGKQKSFQLLSVNIYLFTDRLVSKW